MITRLTIVMVLAWPVWGWAGEHDFRYTHTSGTVIECGGGVCKADGMQLSKYVDCYQRMREAMKAMGQFHYNQSAPDPKTAKDKERRGFENRHMWEQWEAVMKDCVEGGK